METTWDGLPIALDWPRGASVVVQRPNGDVLLLHRAHHGTDFAGPWAWTTPAGSRQPGEAILPAAMRELAEEAGITDVPVAPIDLAGHWALFVAQVGMDMRVDLTDVEHDRFEWVRPVEAYARVKPRMVADGIRRALTVPSDPVTFAPLRRADLPDLVAWQSAEHVRPWWTDAVTSVDAAEKKYGPRIDGTLPTTVDVIHVGDCPVGFIQSAPLAADADYFEIARWATGGGVDTVSIDYMIGEPSLIGQGLGTRMIWHYLHDVVLDRHPDVKFIVADPLTTNVASIRACEKAGFRRVFDFESHPGGPRSALCVFDRQRVIGTPHGAR